MKIRIAALWVWWAVCTTLLLVVWYTAWQRSQEALESQARAAVQQGLRGLPEEFAALHRLQQVLAASKEPLEKLQGRPFVTLSRPPQLRPGLYRPLPPGYTAGQNLSAPPDRESYLIVASATTQAELDLEYVFGPWLRDRVARWNVPGEGTVSRVSPEETWKQPRLQTDWRWRLPSLFGSEPFPFDAIELTVDLGQEHEHITRVYLLGLAAGAVLMLSFALTIGLAARAIQREVQLVEARERFTQMVSHELRTPVTAIKMYAEILENGLVDEAEKLSTYHRILRGEADRLQRLVENLLTLGSFEAGAQGFRLTTFDLQELDLPSALVRADREALRQVLANLTDNARKYGGSGVTVEVRRTPAGVAIDVLDRGPGIPQAERRRIFEPYHRLQHEGVGLGLALVKGLVQGMGGTVTVGDRPGGGAVFTVTLPCP